MSATVDGGGPDEGWGRARWRLRDLTGGERCFLAVPLRVLGMTAGPLLTAAAINAPSVLRAPSTSPADPHIDRAARGALVPSAG